MLDFPERDVKHAMVPRSTVDTIAPSSTVAEDRELVSTGHTRYPVIGDDDELTHPRSPLRLVIAEAARPASIALWASADAVGARSAVTARA